MYVETYPAFLTPRDKKLSLSSSVEKSSEFGWLERKINEKWKRRKNRARLCIFYIWSILHIWSSSLFSVSFSPSVSSCGLGVGSSTSLPLLRVIKALTSLTYEDSPSWASTSWIPLGFWWGWEGNLPFSCTVLRLVSLEIEYWRLSIFWDRSFCIPSILLFNVFSTLSILWLSWASMDFWSPTKSPMTLLRFTIACSRFEAC